MTAIVYDGKTLAADRLLTKEDRIVGYMKKIDHWSGGVWACAGRLDDHEEFKFWLENREYNFKPHRNFQGIFSEDGKMYEILCTMVPMPVIPPIGLGIATDLLESLCTLGYTAKQAVEAAKKIYTTVGGKIDVVKI